MNVLVVDNYDSFTYNLVDYLGSLGVSVDVQRNDAVEVTHDAVVISPGPGTPDDAGASLDVVKACTRNRIPLLGVCLGHQAIAQTFGSRIVRAPAVMHGKTSPIHHNGLGLFRDLPNPFEAMRYHSLVVDEVHAPLRADARTEDGIVMALSHEELPVFGVQFHPESILTPDGKKLLANFLELASCSTRR